MKKKAQMFLPLPIIIFLVTVVIVVFAYMAAPEDKKVLIPVTVVMFIIGVMLEKVNALFSLLLGSLYWMFMEAASRLNIMDNYVVSIVFAPVVILAIIGFLTGRLLGRYILAFMGLGG